MRACDPFLLRKGDIIAALEAMNHAVDFMVVEQIFRLNDGFFCFICYLHLETHQSSKYYRPQVKNVQPLRP
ncbi:hypothetical protein D9M09_24340 [Janthinobacterium agaricidamnosum]|uniref:Uncharacterized protein n=1 Tax=Janthinobacterium agaricidamnosum TaxID=55508 RepID=A0A3G2EGF6_9BURK|nr:hypothetical protein D9M09_24340 [Janthinobacterium agaricidamnosum]